jgi:transposase InsO family protein
LVQEGFGSLAKRLGRKVLDDACSLFTPDTLLKWHRQLVAKKYDGSGNRKCNGKRITPELEELIIMFARKNKTWGSRRIKGALKHLGFNIHHTTIDRDPLFTKEFRSILRDSGVKPIRTLPMALHLNCMIERFVRTIKSECLNKMLIFGGRHLDYLVTEFMKHYNHERPHQGIDDELIEPPPKGTV